MGRESRYLAGHAGPLSSLLEYGPLGMSCPHAGVNQCLLGAVGVSLAWETARLLDSCAGL